MRTKFRRSVFGLLLILSACAPVSTPELQALPSGTTSVTTRIVQVEVTDAPYYRLFVSVRDQLDAAHTAFKLGNFLVTEASRPVPSNEVGVVTDPLYAVLIIDRSGSMIGAGETASEAAGIDFVNNLPIGTSVALIEFASSPTTSVGFTTDKTTVTNAITAGTVDGSTAIYDAIKSGVDLLNTVTGRKLLVALTDGEDNSSDISVEGVIKAVNAGGLSANTVTLDTGGSIDTTPMQNIASQTGGTYFATTNGTDLTAAFLDAIAVFNNLIYVKYRQRKTGDVKLYLNYGDLTATATKSLPEEESTTEATTSAIFLKSN
jgi:Ca-activated chloride channel family protein